MIMLNANFNFIWNGYLESFKLVSHAQFSFTIFAKNYKNFLVYSVVMQIPLVYIQISECILGEKNSETFHDMSFQQSS